MYYGEKLNQTVRMRMFQLYPSTLWPSLSPSPSATRRGQARRDRQGGAGTGDERLERRGWNGRDVTEQEGCWRNRRGKERILGCFDGLLAGWLVAWVFCCLVTWLAGWLVGWYAWIKIVYNDSFLKLKLSIPPWSAEWQNELENCLHPVAVCMHLSFRPPPSTLATRKWALLPLRSIRTSD